MTRSLSRDIAIIAVLLALHSGCGREDSSTTPRVSPNSDTTAQAALPGSFIVVFRNPPQAGGSRFANFLAEARHHVAWLDESFGTNPRVTQVRFITALDISAPEPTPGLGPKTTWITPLQRAAAIPAEELWGAVAQVDFTSDADAKTALSEWHEQGDIWYAEPNYISRLSRSDNDNLFEQLSDSYGKFSYWWLDAINLTAAYDSIAERDQRAPDVLSDEQLKSEGPIVAILDSGVDYEHPALAGRIWTNSDLNASGCNDDLHGCNTTKAKRGRLGNGDVWPFDAEGPGQSCDGRDNNCTHGTHVAGIVAGDASWTKNQWNAAGICPVCRLMILRIVSKVGKESGILDSSILAAFKYVTLSKRDSTPVRIINASFGKFVRSRTVGLLIRLMKERTGTLLVAAAGNEDTLTMEYPAAFKDAVAVAAVNNQLRKVSFSNFGRWVDVSAPGSGILSTVPGSGVESKSGTSMAAPIVAGVAGLYLSRYPDATFDELRHWLLAGADPAFYGSDFADGFNHDFYFRYPGLKDSDGPQPLLGYGIINAKSTLNRTPTPELPVYPANDRVRSGCGVTGIRPNSSPREAPLALLFLTPLIVLILSAAVLKDGS